MASQPLHCQGKHQSSSSQRARRDPRMPAQYWVHRPATLESKARRITSGLQIKTQQVKTHRHQIGHALLDLAVRQTGEIGIERETRIGIGTEIEIGTEIGIGTGIETGKEIGEIGHAAAAAESEIEITAAAADRATGGAEGAARRLAAAHQKADAQMKGGSLSAMSGPAGLGPSPRNGLHFLHLSTSPSKLLLDLRRTYMYSHGKIYQTHIAFNTFDCTMLYGPHVRTDVCQLGHACWICREMPVGSPYVYCCDW